MELLGVSLSVILLLTGTAFILAEAAIPGAHLMVIGTAISGAGLVGVLVTPAQHPAVLAVLVLVFGAGSFYWYRNLGDGDHTETSLSSDELEGTEGIVVSTVTKTTGQVKLDTGGFDRVYSARTPDDMTISEGTDVVVVDGGGGNIVTVEPVADTDD